MKNRFLTAMMMTFASIGAVFNTPTIFRGGTPPRKTRSKPDFLPRGYPGAKRDRAAMLGRLTLRHITHN